MKGGRLVCGLPEDEFERVREAASAAVRTHIANRVEVVEVRPVPDGGYSGSIENGRLSKTGRNPAMVRVALADALQAEEEEEVTVQRLHLTGLALLAATCLDSDEGTDAPQPSSNEEKLREERDDLKLAILRFLNGLHANESLARKELRDAALREETP